MPSVIFIVGLFIDIMVLYYVAGFLRAPGNTFGKALIVILGSLAFGYLIAPVLLASLFASIGLFFLILIVAVFIRLILIKLVYKIRLGQAFAIWILTAIVSIVVSLIFPF